MNVFEDLESLVLRHSKFANFGRFLVEMVVDHGVNGHLHTPQYERGPFFCGINCPLQFGSYAITFKGPCSTTTARSVSLNFAKSNGLNLCIQNDGALMKDQTFLNCSFFSNYFEESERLWIAGRLAQRLVSITMVQNAKNYRKMIRALFLFDAVLSGVWLNGMDIKHIAFKLTA